MAFDDLVALAMKSNPQWGLAECQLWVPSKKLHHPNTAFRNWSNRPAMKDLFAKISAPTLILKADAEGELRQQNEEIANTLQNGTLVHIKDAKHNVHRDQKERLHVALKAFLGPYEGI